jgi:2-C-methyl-D-erythritol 2,4-cyclodiphosphate synthase
MIWQVQKFISKSRSNNMRVGHGFDVHQLAPDRKLIIGGVTIPYHLGLYGHSDADVLIHAINDALLGGASLGDIGCHFPDTDPRYTGISSLLLLQHVVELLERKGFWPVNIDATVIAQQPKLAPFILQMRSNIARTVRISIDRISVKATTTEKLGFAGRGEGIAAHAVALVQHNAIKSFLRKLF